MGRRELTTDDEPTDALWHELLHQFSSYFFRDTSNYYKTVVLDHGGQVESRRTVDELLAHFQFTLTHLFVMSPEPYRPAAGIDKLLGAVNGHLKRHHQWNDAEIRQSIRDGQVLKTSLLHLLQHHSVSRCWFMAHPTCSTGPRWQVPMWSNNSSRVGMGVAGIPDAQRVRTVRSSIEWGCLISNVGNGM